MKVSIIIPTRNRATLLKKTLTVLASQLKPGDQVIVVDNNSQDKTARTVKKFRTHFPMVFLKSLQLGPSAARNLGFQHAKNEIIVFLDDDCIIQANWRKNIEKNVHQFSKTNTIFQGKIINTFLKPSLFTLIFEARNKILWEQITATLSWRKQHIRYLNAGNMYFHRQAVQNFGALFDSRLFPYIGEETDLAYRLQTVGKFIKFTPDVGVIHRKLSSSFLQKLKNAFMLGRLEGILVRKHLADPALQQLFSREIKSLDKSHHQFWFSRKIIQQIQTPHPLTYVIFIPFLFVRDLMYYAGKASAQFNKLDL